mgnify:CR=1 FL=1
MNVIVMAMAMILMRMIMFPRLFLCMLIHEVAKIYKESVCFCRKSVSSTGLIVPQHMENSKSH